jgi:hypothetical protein
MTSVGPFELGVHDAPLDDRDVRRLWASSGCQWLSGDSSEVPTGLVRRIVGMVKYLDRQGCDLDDLVPAQGLGFLAERAALMGLPPAGRRSAGGATQLLPCADGWVALSLARPDDFDLLPAWLEVGLPPGPDEDVWQIVASLLAARRAAPLVERAALLGLPVALVGEMSDDRPVLVQSVGGASPWSLEGAVVVNLASLWAGPLCADILARLGARVITVESTTRPDGGRLARRFFAALHGRCESVALDFATPEGRTVLRDLLECADLVIEGSRPRALEQLGAHAADIVARGPQIWLSITGHGRGVHQRDRVGFGDDAAAAGGLVFRSLGEPAFVADAVADPLAGLTAAAAAAQLADAGGRWVVDVALSRAAHAVAGDVTSVSADAVARPKPRRDLGAPMPLGRDTERVLRHLAPTSGSVAR